MDGKVRIAIADSQTIVRNGLRCILTSTDNLEVVGEAEDGIDAIRCVEALQPDLLLTELELPKMNGVAAIKEIKRRSPERKILVLTAHKSDEDVLEALRAGADGYCLKDATQAELAQAIKTVLAGNRYLSPGIPAELLEIERGRKKTLVPGSSWDKVTNREKEVLKLLAEGHTNKAIADCLRISVKTVEKHRDNLRKKLDLHSASALTAYAIEKGLVTK
ncbi:response regulator transcription factor [Candidatus Poribacteria bacterium]|nr:response regulator transcription factor [Candidatus Poribacteria bacterium]